MGTLWGCYPRSDDVHGSCVDVITSFLSVRGQLRRCFFLFYHYCLSYFPTSYCLFTFHHAFDIVALLISLPFLCLHVYGAASGKSMCSCLGLRDPLVTLSILSPSPFPVLVSIYHGASFI
jgi:hypothetical protein